MNVGTPGSSLRDMRVVVRGGGGRGCTSVSLFYPMEEWATSPPFTCTSQSSSIIFDRYDYENCETAGANSMMQHVEQLVQSAAFVGKAFRGGAHSFKVRTADNFSYKDPVDHTVTSRQGLRILFDDGSRIVYRLSGTGSTGATIRIYLEQYAPAPPATSEQLLFADAVKSLEPLAAVAFDISRIAEFTGRQTPTVIT